uniref:Myosin motor domain-containing protein n=1 Tax=Globisporangium ultimum (strain ATCC 200006 / CBS 805.95 / DAOM BR144) TaxID=431595 RepID=K3X0U3_GLOUD
MTSVSKSKRIPQVHIDGLFFGFYEKLESLEDEEQLRMYFKNPHAAKKLSTVLDSNVLLEAFGNATTSMNLNSSRFGKETNLFFSFDRYPSQYQILGCRLTPFLLETTRVTSARERRPTDDMDMNFHVFYALVAGVNAMPYMRLLAKELRLDSASSETFAYLGRCKHKLQGVWTEEETWKKDVERWQHIVDAMNSMTLTADQQRTIFQMLSAILWLGNIDFEWNNQAQKLDMVSPPSQQAAQNVVDLLGLPSTEKLESMLFTKRINLASTGESFDVSLEKGQVSHVRDTLARLLYQALFFYLIEQMNEATSVDDASLLNGGGEHNGQIRVVKLFDVFGFENLSRNSLEQLCINYLSEKLFSAEEQIVSIHYHRDRIRQSATGEKDVLFLFEHSLGIFASLEELTVLHQGENENWQQEQKKNQLLVRKLYERNATQLSEPPRITGVSGQQWRNVLPFVVPHSREPVTYDATDFVKKNSDFHQSSLLDSLKSSTIVEFQQMIALMKAAAQTPANKKVKASSISVTGSQVNQFRTQIQALTAQDDDHMPLYMHCIRPNSSGRPSQIEAEVVARQINSQRIPPQIQ